MSSVVYGEDDSSGDEVPSCSVDPSELLQNIALAHRRAESDDAPRVQATPTPALDGVWVSAPSSGESMQRNEEASEKTIDVSEA